jgi:hypothetical protein
MLISKEIRGVQIDQLAQTLRPEEAEDVDPRKLARARFEVRDLGDMLLPESEVELRQQAQQQAQAKAQQQQAEMLQATIRDTLANAFKNIAQGQKNIATTEKTRVDAVTATLGALGGDSGGEGDTAGSGNSAGIQALLGGAGGADVAGLPGEGRPGESGQMLQGAA